MSAADPQLLVADAHNAGWIPFRPSQWRTNDGRAIAASNLSYLQSLDARDWQASWRGAHAVFALRSLGAFGSKHTRLHQIERETRVLQRRSASSKWLRTGTYEVDRDVATIGYLLEDAELLIGIDAVAWLRAQHIRVVQPLYSFRSRLGDGCYVSDDRGLTDAGLRLVRELDAAGLIIDAAHASTRSITQLLGVAGRVIVSHGTLAAVERHPRGVSASSARRLGQKIEFFGQIVGPTPLPVGRATLIDWSLRRLTAAVECFGVDRVGIASDWQWGWEDSQVLTALDAAEGRNNDAWRRAGALARGVTLEDILDRLARDGWPELRIRAVAGENLMRMLAAMSARREA